MDRRSSWPWKKKSSNKQVAEKAATSDDSIAASDAGVTQIEKAKKDYDKKAKYVQISIESYTHLTGLEDQVKSYEEEVKTLEDENKELNEKLSEAHLEMTNKENLVKQHAKVAEEAVSGWEKAEAEAAALKTHLESVTLLKLTSEDRAAHLDGALKECMKQIRTLKEENDRKVNEIILTKTRLFDNMKLDLEAKIDNLDKKLLKSAAENAAVSRSLQERSNMLVKLSEEKSRAEKEIDFLKGEIDSREKEINSHKYELHIAMKQVEIRNEEKNMSERSADIANKQHLEGVKKIAKLEAECQRLRGLVRKKLPGPGALAQMKIEVENLGREYGETRPRRSDISPDFTQKCVRENEMLTERLLAMEEEMKMLKEALASRNSELEASRSLCAETVSKIRSLEAKIEVESQAPTEEGNGKSNSLDLMDDFLEMEKLAYQSNGPNGAEPSKHKESSGTISDVPVALAKDARISTNQELEIAYSRICEFVTFLDKEANNFSAKYSEAINSEINPVDFILDVSEVLNKPHNLNFNFSGFKSIELEESTGSDCIDKIALPENKSNIDSSDENFSKKCTDFSDSSLSHPDIPHNANLDEFERLKMEKGNLVIDLARCTEEFEITKARLAETEEILGDVKSQLALAHKSNSLAETQLRCMAESYELLEKRAEELQSEVNILQGKIEGLDIELQEERKCHQEALTKFKDLQEQLQRIESFAGVDNDDKTSQEKELSAAAEKLAECQETILLLGKQLKNLRPPTDPNSSPIIQTSQKFENSFREEPSVSAIDSPKINSSETDTRLDPFNDPFRLSDSEANNVPISPVGSKYSKHRHTKSGSSSASSTATPEKQGRGFTRFFSSKGRNSQ